MKLLRVLMVHNYYQQEGGEDGVFVAEKELLAAHGHEVVEYTDNNSRINEMNRFSTAINMIWSNISYHSIRKIIKSRRPDIVHFHNTFMMVSPSAYYACREEGVPVVQTLHNFRLLCPVATFSRNFEVCEECLGKFFALPGVIHACYRGSKLQTAGVSTMVSLHKIFGTWNNMVNEYVVMTNFSRDKFIEGGLPAHKIFVKPHFIGHDPGIGETNGDFVLFVGRLSNEKGVLTMLKTWQTFSSSIPLKIAGDGPMRDQVLKYIKDHSLKDVEYLGLISHEKVLSLMKEARFLIFPSEGYEGFGMVIVEAFACGLPVVSSSLGGVNEIIEDKKTGTIFYPGDVADLASKVSWLWSHPEETARMGKNARQEYEQKYSPDVNYQMLIKIYERAMRRSAR